MTSHITHQGITLIRNSPVPGEEQDSHMVVPVQEDQWLLPQHDENCVAELRHLGHGEEIAPEGRHCVVLNKAVEEQRAVRKQIK